MNNNTSSAAPVPTTAAHLPALAFNQRAVVYDDGSYFVEEYEGRPLNLTVQLPPLAPDQRAVVYDDGSYYIETAPSS